MAKGLLVILTLNEEGSLGLVLHQAKSFYPDIDILVVDGESRDRTAEVGKQQGARVAVLSPALGISGAMEAALMYAHQFNYDYIIRIDGDGQHPVSETKALLDRVSSGDCDLAVGSRFAGEGMVHYQGSLIRNFAIRVFAFFVSRSVGKRITDPTSGMQVLNKKVISYFARIPSFEYSEIESLVILGRAGFCVEEIKVKMEERQAGSSSFDMGRAFFYFSVGLFSLLLHFFRRPAPQPVAQGTED